MEINIDLGPVIDTINQLDWTQKTEVLTFAANEIMRVMDEYVPFDTGILKNTAYVTPMGDEIVYPAPYAQYLYNGYLMVDPITKKGAFYDPVRNRYWSRPNTPKELTTTPLHFAGEPKRGAHWAERAWDEHGEEIAESIARYIERKL